LQQQGRFAESLAAYRKGNAPAPVVREAERLPGLDRKVSLFLKGKLRPDAAEALSLAWFCRTYKKPGAATRRYRAAFATSRKRAQAGVTRYVAAGCAALAGSGKDDGARLDAAERARFREEALSWLQTDLKAWQAALKKPPATGGMRNIWPLR